jgi:hypothetical protein
MYATYTDIRPENGSSNIFRNDEKFLFLYATQSRKPIKRKITVETVNKRF